RRLRVRDERQSQLLVLFGLHRLEQRELTAGDRELFEAYQDLLRARNLVDFDDLIALTERLLRTNQPVAMEQPGRFDHVLVDEFQHVHLAEYGVVRLLTARHSNLFVVGDDEQSIFSWTGADPSILRRFSEDLELARPIVLDRNRRCSIQIFEAARRLV